MTPKTNSNIEIFMISIGGSISMIAQTSREGVSPSLQGLDLLRTVPGLEHMMAVHVESPYTIPSGHLGLEDLMKLSNRVNEIAESNPEAGLVITTGTDTLEEAAYFIDLTYCHANPVVFTGAMRDASQISPDGPRNIKDAALTAACSECRDLGVMVVLNGEIHAARDVTKTHTTDVSSFRSPMSRPLGAVHSERIVMRRKPWSREYIDTKRVAQRVELLKCVIGGDGRAMFTMMDLGVDGFVVEAFGGGHVPPGVRDAIAQAVKKEIPVVVTSRCHWGELLVHTYDYQGSEIDLRALGALFVGCLNGPKARVKLSLCLGAGMTGNQLASYFPD
jgi:L-asparaginase